MEITRRAILSGAAALGASAFLNLESATAAARGFRFVYMTDLHLQPELGAPDGVAKAVQKILTLTPRPDFVITGGDHVMDALAVSQSRADQQFQLLSEALRPLEMPIYQTIGNHDVYGWSDKSGAQPSDPDYGKKMFENRVSKARTYRSFDFGEWHFVLLDSIQFVSRSQWRAEIDDTQLQWLKQDLEQTGKRRPIVMVSHVPLLTLFTQYENGTTKAPSDTSIVRNGKEVRDLFVPYNVKAVLQGHTHVVEECIYTGARYITGGAICGDWWKGPRLGVHPEGFAVIDIQKDQFKWEYVSYGWKARKA